MKIELSRHIFKMQANVIVRLDVEIFVFVSRANCKFHPKVFVFAKRCKVVQKYFPLPAFSSIRKHGACILTVVYILQILQLLQLLEEYIPLIRKHGACILSPGWHFFFWPTYSRFVQYCNHKILLFCPPRRRVGWSCRATARFHRHLVFSLIPSRLGATLTYFAHKI